MTASPMVIALDGPAAAGKGTLARRLAEQYDLAILDTGLLYRAVGWKVVNAGADPEDAAAAVQAAEALVPSELESPELRLDQAAQAASKVAVIPDVRANLLEFQRSFAKNPPDGKKGAVIDGRDIGTVVCPDADVKLFLNASAEVRALRRHEELLGRGHEAIYARVLDEMKERDARDASRAVAPLKAADDAFELDTSDLDADQVFERVVAFIKTGNRS